MLEKLSEKDQKTVTTGGVILVACLLLYGMYEGFSLRKNSIKEYEDTQRNLQALNLSDSAYKNLLASVPVFRMPLEEQDQKMAFRDSLDQLFEQMRISTEPWIEVASNTRTTSPLPGYGILKLKTSTRDTVSFQRILYLLAALKENPYYAGIEELKITCDPQNPQSADLSIVLSTFTKDKNTKRVQ